MLPRIPPTPRVVLPVSTSAGWRAFRHRNYRLFFAGQLVSQVGTWMQTVAQGWLVLTLTHNPFVLGLLTAIQFLPVLVLGLGGGLVADLWPKRRTLVCTQSAMALLALVLWALTASGVVTVPMIMLLAFGLGCANAVDMPTRQSFVVEMVGREDVPNAVAFNSAMFNMARIVGPAVAGLTIAAAGEATAFLLNALSFLAVIGGLLLMREEDLRGRARLARPTSLAGIGRDLNEGLLYARHTPIVLLAISVAGVVSLFGINFNVLVPAYTQGTLGLGADSYGFLMSAAGVGSLLAALLIAFRGRARPTLLLSGALLLGAAEVGIAAVHALAPAALLLFLCGVGSITMSATANTLIQLSVPDALRGRVLAIYTTVFNGSTPIGGPLVGAIASVASPSLAFGISGAISACTALAAVAWLRVLPAPRPLSDRLPAGRSARRKR